VEDYQVVQIPLVRLSVEDFVRPVSIAMAKSLLNGHRAGKGGLRIAMETGEQNLQRSTEPAGSARPDNLPQKKDAYVNEVLGGLSRITFQMGVSTLPHQKMVRSIELPGTRVAPVVRKELTLLSSR